MSLKNSNSNDSTTGGPLPSPPTSNDNLQDDSDYDSMFGDDNSDDSTSMFGDDDSDDKNNNNNNDNVDGLLLLHVPPKTGEDDSETKNTHHVSSTETTSSDTTIQVIPTKSSTKHETLKIPRKKPNGGTSSASIRKKRRLSSSISSSAQNPHDATADNYYYDNKNKTDAPSFDINSYYDYPNDAIDPTLFEDVEQTYDSTTSSSTAIPTKKKVLPPLKILKPDEYPTCTMNDFWRTFRGWDFLKELNQSVKKQSSSNLEDRDLRPLPDEFHCHEQYIALWSPLLLREAKAQIMSDVSSLHTTSSPLSKYVQPVQVTVKNAGSSSNNSDEDHLTLSITLSSQDQRSSSQRQTISNHRGGPQGRSAKIAQNLISRNEYVQNEMVYLITEPSFLDQACKGTLKGMDDSNGKSNTSTYCMMSLILNSSPFSKGKLGVVGVVSQRCKNLKNGLLVQISKRLLKENAPSQFNLFLLRLGHSVTGKFCTV